jgi:hypothetical protein
MSVMLTEADNHTRRLRQALEESESRRTQQAA